MAKYTATVEMDARGRVVVPKPIRRQLGIEGESATLEIEVGRADD